MLRPMPSPTGRNVEKRYIIDRRAPLAAYDEMPDMGDADKLKLLEFLRDKLSPEDHRTAARLLDTDVDAAMDDGRGGPEPFKGMPEPSGTKFGQDSASPALQRARVNAARIRVSF